MRGTKYTVTVVSAGIASLVIIFTVGLSGADAHYHPAWNSPPTQVSYDSHQLGSELFDHMILIEEGRLSHVPSNIAANVGPDVKVTTAK